MLKKILLGTLVLFLIGYGFICWSLSTRILTSGSSMERTQSRINKFWKKSKEEFLAPLPPPEDFSISSFDKTTIKGKYFQKSDTAQCAIILAHGWSSNWVGMLKYTPLFSNCGCDLIFFDQRAHGESDRVPPTGSINESKDLLAITEWVKTKRNFTNQQIGWMGASWGAATALMAGADKMNVAFIIADSPFQDWYSAIFERAIRDYGGVAKLLAPGVMQMVNWRTGIDYQDASPLLAASKIEEPVLLIHSQGDSQTASAQSVNISKNLGSSSKFYHTDWGSDHTGDVTLHPEKFIQLVDDFLEEIEGFGGCGNL